MNLTFGESELVGALLLYGTCVTSILVFTLINRSVISDFNC
jgi:hypothetical protein